MFIAGQYLSKENGNEIFLLSIKKRFRGGGYPDLMVRPLAKTTLLYLDLDLRTLSKHDQVLDNFLKTCIQCCVLNDLHILIVKGFTSPPPFICHLH